MSEIIKRKLDLYKMKKKFLSEEERVENYERFLAIDQETGMEIIVSERFSEIETTSDSGFNGSISVSEVAYFFSSYSNAKGTFEYVLGMFDKDLDDGVTVGSHLLGAKDWMEKAIKSNPVNLEEWTRDGNKTITIQLSKLELDFYSKFKRELWDSNVVKVDDIYELVDEIFLDSWDFYHPYEMYNKSKELKELYDIYQEEYSDGQEERRQNLEYKLFDLWAIRFKKLGEVYCDQDDSKIYDSQWNEIDWGVIFK